MFGFRFDRVRPGRRIAARPINQLARGAEWLSRTGTAAPLGAVSSALGLALQDQRTPAIAARLSGSGSPYSWQEVYATAGGGYAALAGGRSGAANCYEVNGAGGLDGQVVAIVPTEAGDYRFQLLRTGGVPCEGTGLICAQIVSDGCGAGGVVYGALITVKDSASPPNTVGTCTTSGVVTALGLTAAGSGYNSGTGYALGFSGGGGSGAAGTFDVVGGQIANLALTSGGSGYTSAPTVSFPGAGSGAGASAFASVVGRCCVAIPKSGAYTLSCDLPGASTLSTAVAAVCHSDNTTSLSYPANSLGTVCFQFNTCTSSGNIPIGGATVSITGSGTASGTSGPDGSLCMRLGVGAYSAAITFPSGYSTTIGFSVNACGVTTVSLTTVTAVCVSCVTSDPAGCTAGITIVRLDNGAVLGTGSLTTSNLGGLSQGQTCIPITESGIGVDFDHLGVGWSWANFSVSPTSTAVPLACWASESPIAFDFRVYGSPC